MRDHEAWMPASTSRSVMRARSIAVRAWRREPATPMTAPRTSLRATRTSGADASQASARNEPGRAAPWGTTKRP